MSAPEGFKKNWHVEKRINLGDIVGILTIVVPFTLAIMSWGSTLSHQVTVNQESIKSLSKKDAQQDERVNRLEARTERSLTNINNKLDKLIEYQLEQQSQGR